MATKRAPKRVLVVIGDIKKSRNLKSRGDVQKRFKNCLAALNKKNKSVLSPYTITVGDEFQVVLKSAYGLFRDLFYLMGEMHPVKLRFSIAVGELSTPINQERAIGMDGPAFHSARQGIEELKTKAFAFSVSGFENYTRHTELTLLVFPLTLISLFLKNWKALRYKIVVMLLENRKAPEIAQSLGVSTRSVYKNSEAGVLELWAWLTDKIETELNKILESK